MRDGYRIPAGSGPAGPPPPVGSAVRPIRTYEHSERRVSLVVHQIERPRQRSLPPLWLVAVLVAVAAFAAWLTPARAHSFYPYECCSDRDCWPTGSGADAKEPDPVAGPGGWRLFDGAIVPYAATRPSPDGRFHVCRSGGALKGALIVPSGRQPCLWVPPNGS